jgi:preprotein translocase subunit SecF
MKFVRPLYRALASVVPDIAKATFEKYSSIYHPIARKMIATDLSTIPTTNEKAATASAIVNLKAESSASTSNQQDTGSPPFSSSGYVAVAVALVSVSIFVLLRYRK